MVLLHFNNSFTYRRLFRYLNKFSNINLPSNNFFSLSMIIFCSVFPTNDNHGQLVDEYW